MHSRSVASAPALCRPPDSGVPLSSSSQTPLLDRVRTPADLRQFPDDQLPQLAEELRRGRVRKCHKERDEQKPHAPARNESMTAPEDHGAGFSRKTRQIQASPYPHDCIPLWNA